MILDLFIILLAAAAVYAGRSSGFLRRFWASLGFFGGLMVGRWLEPYALRFINGVEEQVVAIVVILLGSALIGLSLGELVGNHFKRRLLNPKLNLADNFLGALLSIIIVLFSAWLLASISRTLPSANIRNTVDNSRIVSAVSRLLPPAPQVIASLGRLINPNGFPDVFIGNDPIPSGRVDLPELGELEGTVNAVKDSVVRIRGQGCGGIVAGSGFVVGRNLVATNAHVVAGIDRPFVQDINGTRRATVIWFNPDLDFAILRASNLAGDRLQFRDGLAPYGTPSVVLGYPEGGDFTASPAAVLANFTARGRDIYGYNPTLRHVYEIQANITSGNSGGPLIDKEGRVVGVVFAESTSYDNIGYALAGPAVEREISQAVARNQTVDTGACAR